MQAEKILILTFAVFLNGCTISGNYEYTKEGISEKHKKETTLTYKGKINNIDYKVYNKINFDPQNLDKPPYYETSYEIWFW